MSAVTFHVVCPVCNEQLTYEHTQPEAWGVIPITDLGCAEVTRCWSENVEQHLNKHREDGSWLKAITAHYEAVARNYTRALERLRGERI